MTTETIIPRGPGGQFAPGGPGRLPGTKNRHSLAALQAVQALSSESIAKLKERIEASDMAAIRFVLEYTLPRGGRAIDLGTSDPNAIVDAMAHGDISPDEAARMAQAVKTVGDAAEMKELKKQVEELETIVASLRPR